MAAQKALIIGGNRFFGRHLARALLEKGYEVTLLNRGQHPDGLGDPVERLKADRTRESELRSALQGRNWDLVFDQVCYDAVQARAVCELLRGHAGRLLFTSSLVVYPYGQSKTEADFDPASYAPDDAPQPTSDYALGKMQAEAVVARYPELRPVMARLPFVIGTDDYTQRLLWHIERCRRGQPIYFPSPRARVGFVRSDWAGQSMLAIAESKHVGPINCANPGELALDELLALIESIVKKPAERARQPSGESHSPYGVAQDWTMSLKTMNGLGIELPELSTWLPALVTELAGPHQKQA